MTPRAWFKVLGCSVLAAAVIAALTRRGESQQCQGFFWYDAMGGAYWTESCTIPGQASAGWLTWSWTDPSGTCYDYRSPYCNYADGGSPSPDSCGDERDTMIAEYATRRVNFRPYCVSFSNGGGSANFSWSELNGGFQQGNPHNPWGIIRPALTGGLEATRANYNRGGIRLTSGYRCPHGNSQADGAPQSLHMHGRAADMYSNDHPWTEDEFNLLKAAADVTGPAESFFWNTYLDRHYHAAW